MTRFGRLFRDGVTTFAPLALIGLLALKMKNRPELVQTGRFYVVDADTLARDGNRLRLIGIDAPVFRQQCQCNLRDWARVTKARKAFDKLMKTGAGECRVSKHDRYGRLSVTCKADDVDINGAMVRRRIALSYGGYAAEEVAACKAKAGLLAGDFERPRDYRREEQMDRKGDRLAGLGGYLRRIVGWDR
ncbi:thermonuclease family protein [Rhizobium calliandrae]|uniref:Thermonuclease family protein n=1 Tax=Rhizobium calliandrae TaxID=1312182 RepID=A0ABT7KAF8_9HYPH|nr:thermonuclease family protein [Rhizobium calliandrae]MDL2405598.1 thermonuclease family protein [Rhizobium calliandrae]